ncbi:hypothetical protein AVEN_15238-1 [Araneus ventricosus]|uniref:Uncharacterized protein n=1 Tax=Araneus ventricosus TaxID=182803 RepID=A0A4Y2UWG5_ARAVE|nr:hypothetical protein AVEN_15238-1 [Araneus ventricosus]
MISSSNKERQICGKKIFWSTIDFYITELQSQDSWEPNGEERDLIARKEKKERELETKEGERELAVKEREKEREVAAKEKEKERELAVKEREKEREFAAKEKEKEGEKERDRELLLK